MEDERHRCQVLQRQTRELAYTVFSYLKREAGTICISLSAPPTFICVDQYNAAFPEYFWLQDPFSLKTILITPYSNWHSHEHTDLEEYMDKTELGNSVEYRQKKTEEMIETFMSNHLTM
jgi:hypothetical protein